LRGHVSLTKLRAPCNRRASNSLAFAWSTLDAGGEFLMGLRQKYVKILSGILPAGAVGVALLLGSTGSSTANQHPTTPVPSTSDRDGIAERLAAIREAVSEVADTGDTESKPGDRNMRLAWGNWWNNGGWGWARPWGAQPRGDWGWPNWNNWNNWHNWNNWNNWWRNW